jgi:cytochrome c oxidase subunit 1
MAAIPDHDVPHDAHDAHDHHPTGMMRWPLSINASF